MRKVVKIRKYNQLNEAGFSNPFANDDDLRTTDILSIEPDSTKKKVNSIYSVNLWNPNTKTKIIYRNDRVFANQYFCAGDTVEECPVKLMEEKDLYSETIRACVFPIDLKKGIYALPLGYGVCYRNSVDSGIKGNIDYDFFEDSNTLVFTALSNIKKGTELIIKADEKDFANVIKPGQFKYDQDVDTIYRVKDYKFV